MADAESKPKPINKDKIEELILEYGGVTEGLDLNGRIFSRTLSDTKLRGVKWREGNLRGASLKRVDFTGAEFTGADFSPWMREAGIAGTEPILEQTDLEGTVFASACLDGANFSKAKLSGANFDRAVLRAWKRDAETQRTDFSEALLEDASFRSADLTQACLAKADLTNADLSKAVLVDADLSGADLSGTKLAGANLSRANLSEADLKDADLTGAVLTGANLQRANLTNITWTNSRFNRSSLGDKIIQEAQHQYEEANQIFLALKKHFNEIGDYDAASWAYIQERTMERKTFSPKWAIKFYHAREVPEGLKGFQKLRREAAFRLKYLLKWLWSGVVMWGFMGYGERPTNALIFSAASILFFTVLFAITGGLVHDGNPEQPITLIDYFLHSLGSFSTTPYMDATTTFAWLLTGFEGSTGVIALAAFTAALGQRIGSR